MKRSSVCKFAECLKPVCGYGYCKGHYQQYKAGKELKPLRPRFKNVDEGFDARVKRIGECLIWQGAVDANGYGKASIGGGKQTHAHRYAWQRKNGPIPKNRIVDHICHERRCVELSHLRLVTYAQNAANRSGAPITSTTGVRNVTRRKSGTYMVKIKRNNASHYKSGFASLREAADYAEWARTELFGDYAGNG